MKSNLSRPFKIFWAVCFFITCACALLSLLVTLTERPVDNGHIAVQGAVAVAAGLLGAWVIRKPRF